MTKAMAEIFLLNFHIDLSSIFKFKIDGNSAEMAFSVLEIQFQIEIFNEIISSISFSSY